MAAHSSGGSYGRAPGQAASLAALQARGPRTVPKELAGRNGGARSAIATSWSSSIASMTTALASSTSRSYAEPCPLWRRNRAWVRLACPPLR